MKRCFMGILKCFRSRTVKKCQPATLYFIPGLLTFACDFSIFHHVKLEYHLQAKVSGIHIQNSFDCTHYFLKELQHHLKYSFF